MKWFRFYSEVWHDPKVERLSPRLFKAWVLILCLANEGKPRGRLPESERDIAYGLRLNITQTRRVVADLIEARLLSHDGERLTPHNWDARQPAYDHSTERVNAWKQQKSNVAGTLRNKADTEVEVDTEPETDTENLLLLRPNIFHLYAQTFGPVTQRVRDLLVIMEKEHPPEWIEAAFNEAAMNGGRSLRYVETILRRWEHEERQEETAKVRRAEEDDAIEAERARLRAEREARESG